jgi:hypothetical protein
MVKNRTPPALPTLAKRRGRPPRPGGPTPQAVVQKAYRARTKAAGKIVKLIDPAAMSDPAEREKLHNALSISKLWEEEASRLKASNLDLEDKAKLQAQHHSEEVARLEAINLDLEDRVKLLEDRSAYLQQKSVNFENRYMQLKSKVELEAKKMELEAKFA